LLFSSCVQDEKLTNSVHSIQHNILKATFCSSGFFCAPNNTHYIFSSLHLTFSINKARKRSSKIQKVWTSHLRRQHEGNIPITQHPLQVCNRTSEIAICRCDSSD